MLEFKVCSECYDFSMNLMTACTHRLSNFYSTNAENMLDLEPIKSLITVEIQLAFSGVLLVLNAIDLVGEPFTVRDIDQVLFN